MIVTPKHQQLEAFHFSAPDDFADLLRFVMNSAKGRSDGRLQIDGHDASALVTTEHGNIKVNRYEWLIRLGNGLYKTMNNTEFESTYQRAAA